MLPEWHYLATMSFCPFTYRGLVFLCELLYLIVMRKTFSVCPLINMQVKHVWFDNGFILLPQGQSGHKEKFASVQITSASSLPGKWRLFHQQSGQHSITLSYTIILFWKSSCVIKCWKCPDQSIQFKGAKDTGFVLEGIRSVSWLVFLPCITWVCFLCQKLSIFTSLRSLGVLEISLNEEIF